MAFQHEGVSELIRRGLAAPMDEQNFFRERINEVFKQQFHATIEPKHFINALSQRFRKGGAIEQPEAFVVLSDIGTQEELQGVYHVYSTTLLQHLVLESEAYFTNMSNIVDVPVLQELLREPESGMGISVLEKMLQMITSDCIVVLDEKNASKIIDKFLSNHKTLDLWYELFGSKQSTSLTTMVQAVSLVLRKLARQVTAFKASSERDLCLFTSVLVISRTAALLKNLKNTHQSVSANLHLLYGLIYQLLCYETHSKMDAIQRAMTNKILEITADLSYFIIDLVHHLGTPSGATHNESLLLGYMGMPGPNVPLSVEQIVVQSLSRIIISGFNGEILQWNAVLDNIVILESSLQRLDLHALLIEVKQFKKDGGIMAPRGPGTRTPAEDEASSALGFLALL